MIATKHAVFKPWIGKRVFVRVSGYMTSKPRRTYRKSTVADLADRPAVFLCPVGNWGADVIVVQKFCRPPGRIDNPAIPLRDKKIFCLHMQRNVIPKHAHCRANRTLALGAVARHP